MELPRRVSERLEALRARPIDATQKGFSCLGGATAASIASASPPLHAAGLTYPLLSLRESALDSNLRAMAAYCASAGVDLAPHGKTGMSPELAARQLAHGAWGITVATIGQLRTYRGFGFPRLLLANELVDENGITWLAAELAADPRFEAYCYVDSLQQIDLFSRTFCGTTLDRPLPVLVEIGHENGRTGCRTDQQAAEVAKAAAASGVLRVAGVAGYEGSIKGGDELGRVTAFSRRLRGLAEMVRSLGDPAAEFILTAGGSTYFDVVAHELTSGDTSGLRVVLRSGAYLYFDHGIYADRAPAKRGRPAAAPASGTAPADPVSPVSTVSTVSVPELRPAIELWAQVLSRPEPGLALLCFGRRDAGFDAGLPVPLRAFARDADATDQDPTDRNPADRDATDQDATDQDPADRDATDQDATDWKITALDDQHAYLELDAQSPLAPGDLVCLGISHPCTTLDKWGAIPVVDDDGHIVDVVHTFF
jgi:D-serine dehydratase